MPSFVRSGEMPGLGHNFFGSQITFSNDMLTCKAAWQINLKIIL